MNSVQEVKEVSDPPHQVEQEPQTQHQPTSRVEPKGQTIFLDNKETEATTMPARMGTFTAAKSQVDTMAPLATGTKVVAALTKAHRRMGVVLDGWTGWDSKFCVCID